MPDKPLALEDVHKIAALARLTLLPGEAEGLLGDMRNILTYVDKLEELPTDHVPPTAHAVELPTKLRADVARPGLPIETALKNAPEPIGQGFGVPKIIE